VLKNKIQVFWILFAYSSSMRKMISQNTKLVQRYRIFET